MFFRFQFGCLIFHAKFPFCLMQICLDSFGMEALCSQNANCDAYEMVTENAVISGKNASPPTQTWFANIEQQVHSIQRKVRHLQGKESPEQPQPLVPSEARHGVDEHSSEREKEHSSNILKPERSSIVRKQPSAQSVAAAAGAKVKQEIEKNNFPLEENMFKQISDVINKN